MQKTKFIFTTIAFLGAFFFGHAQFSGSGTGAADTPYLITNATQLSEMRNFLGESGINKHFQLMNSIDLSEFITQEDPVMGWLPIGSSTDDAESFHGFLHGGDFTISNLWINRASTDNIGLFGSVKGGGIDHLTIQIDLLKSITGRNNVGGFSGIIEAAAIADCHFTGNITAGENVGGLIGTANQDVTIENNSALVTLTATGNNIGGLIGITSSAVHNCISSGTITTAGDNIGGLIGSSSAAVSGSSSAADVSNTGTVFVGNFMGGLVGVAQSTVTDCNASGSVSGTNLVGGLVGDSYALISNSHATGQVNGNVYVGGLIGGSDAVENCYATGAVNSEQNVIGGLVGQSYGSITRSYSEGAVVGAKSIGGLVGIANMAVSHSYSSSDVTGIAPENIPEGGLIDIGGLIGSSFSTISNCYATGNVTTPQNSMYVGGLAGLTSGEVTNCYASGSVLTEAYSLIGGLIGDAWAPVANCVAANPAIKGSATGNLAKIHRLVGELEFDGAISNSYALETMRVNGSNGITGTDDSLQALNKTVAELQAQTTYENSLGWDFDAIWAIREGHGYPYFGWKEYFTSIISSSVNDELQGSISPIGDVSIEDGNDRLYAITPATGYQIDHVLVDGENTGSEATYLFADVLQNHTIVAVFSQIGLGTDDMDFTDFSMYPNPITDVLNISYKETISEVSIYNLLGQQVITETVNGEHARIDLSKLSSGTYLVRVLSGNKVKSAKIIKL